MDNYKVFKNFLSHSECDELSSWIFSKQNTFIFQSANMGGHRYTTRFTDPSSFSYPSLAYQIQERIISVLGLQNFNLPPYKDGMVASHAHPDDTCYEHLDPEWYSNKKTLHCNAVLNDFEGGEPYIENQSLKIQKRDLICYFVSEKKHGSRKVLGATPRNLWIFGFCI